MIRLQRVESSAVEAMGYDGARGELHLVFTGGRRYAYSGVSDRLLQDLLQAESIGGFVNRRVKAHYPYREIRHGPARTLPSGAS